jgi:hypothetical protein
MNSFFVKIFYVFCKGRKGIGWVELNNLKFTDKKIAR